MSEYRQGDRVELVHTSDTYTRLRPGCRGTVQRLDRVDGRRILAVRWDSGSRLALLIDEGDEVKRVPPASPDVDGREADRAADRHEAWMRKDAGL
jgi:hypothetical protein